MAVPAAKVVHAHGRALDHAFRNQAQSRTSGPSVDEPLQNGHLAAPRLAQLQVAHRTSRRRAAPGIHAALPSAAQAQAPVPRYPAAAPPTPTSMPPPRRPPRRHRRRTRWRGGGHTSSSRSRRQNLPCSSPRPLRDLRGSSPRGCRRPAMLLHVRAQAGPAWLLVARSPSMRAAEAVVVGREKVDGGGAEYSPVAKLELDEQFLCNGPSPPRTRRERTHSSAAAPLCRRRRHSFPCHQITTAPINRRIRVLPHASQSHLGDGHGRLPGEGRGWLNRAQESWAVEED